MKLIDLDNMTQEDIAKFIAYLAHKGQTRRPGILPYIVHPEAVAESFPKDAIKERATAWLHDVLEENPRFTREILRFLGIDEDIINAVSCLTKKSGQGDDVYIERILENPLATKVKIADIKHNLSCNPSEKAKARYPLVLKRLESVLNANT